MKPQLEEQVTPNLMIGNLKDTKKKTKEHLVQRLNIRPQKSLHQLEGRRDHLSHVSVSLRQQHENH